MFGDYSIGDLGSIFVTECSDARSHRMESSDDNTVS